MRGYPRPSSSCSTRYERPPRTNPRSGWIPSPPHHRASRRARCPDSRDGPRRGHRGSRRAPRAGGQRPPQGRSSKPASWRSRNRFAGRPRIDRPDLGSAPRRATGQVRPRREAAWVRATRRPARPPYRSAASTPPVRPVREWEHIPWHPTGPWGAVFVRVRDSIEVAMAKKAPKRPFRTSSTRSGPAEADGPLRSGRPRDVRPGPRPAELLRARLPAHPARARRGP